MRAGEVTQGIALVDAHAELSRLHHREGLVRRGEQLAVFFGQGCFFGGIRSITLLLGIGNSDTEGGVCITIGAL